MAREKSNKNCNKDFSLGAGEIIVVVTEIKRDVKWMKGELSNIKKKVENHIPHRIERLERELYEFKNSNTRWLVGILVSLIFLLVGVIFNLLQ